MRGASELADHWNGAYADGDADRSWTQARPNESLVVIRRLAAPTAGVIDVGGGASRLTACLLSAGFRDLTVLDVSRAALSLAQERLGDDADKVQWIAADLLSWAPQRQYAVWHDRAVLHFFTTAEDRAAYGRQVQAAVAPGGHAVIATFALNGPERCSGLPVRRSDAAGVMEVLGPEFTLRDSFVGDHRTPSGKRQPFTWVVAQRAAE